MTRNPWLQLLAASTLLLAACGPPADRVLVRRFELQRARFEELRVAACQLPIWQHINDSGLTDPEMDKARVDWFLGRMREVGAHDLVVQGRLPDCIVQLGIWAFGYAGTPADYKNYVYTRAVRPEGTTRIVRNLDNPPSSDRSEALERPLGDGWWLEYVSYP